jgi:hypothetical protein
LKWQSSGSPPSAFWIPYDSFREQGDYRVADGSDSSDMNTNYDAMKVTDSTKLDDFMCFAMHSSHWWSSPPSFLPQILYRDSLGLSFTRTSMSVTML